MESSKRKDYLSWDEFFMGVAILSSGRSKDPNTQVGACIVDTNNRILSIGYNGTPNGFDDDLFYWNREGNNLETKYPYVCHAELNAILHAARQGVSVKNATLYTTLRCCTACSAMIAQAGITRVVYKEDYRDMSGVQLLKQHGVIVEQLVDNG